MAGTKTLIGRRGISTFKTPNRDDFIKFRVSYAEKVYYQQLAEKNDITVSELIRQAVKNF